MLSISRTTKNSTLRKVTSQLCCRFMFASAAEESLPKIRVPQQMVKKINKLLKRQAVNKASRPNKAHSGTVVLNCKRKEYNHHMGQEYSDFKPHMLASNGWKHKKSAGDFFTVNNFDSIPAFKNTDVSEFDDLGLRSDVLNIVKSMSLENPTRVQAMAIPMISQGNNTLLSAETGSGKTLAYLIPLVENLLEHRKHYGTNQTSWSPNAVILAPSRELVIQIATVAEQLAQPLGLNVVSLKGGQRLGGQRGSKELDIIVSTPGILRKALSLKTISISAAQHIVIDECDTLMDDSFNGLVKNILKKMQIQTTLRDGGLGDGAQLIMVGATVPKDLNNILSGILPMESVTRVTTPYLHRVMPHVVQKFHRLTSHQRPVHVMQLAKSSTRGKIPTMVFCNQTSTSAWLTKFLEENGVEALLIQGSLREEFRRDIFQRFKDGEKNILISTDVCSRGLDTLHVRRVINYDFPLFMSDYIHRVGRVGRVGSKALGHVHNFITHKWDVDLVWKIETAIRKMTDLHNVNANIKRKLFHLTENNDGDYDDQK